MRRRYLYLILAVIIAEGLVIGWLFSLDQRVNDLVERRAIQSEGIELASIKINILKLLLNKEATEQPTLIYRAVFRSHQPLREINQDFIDWLETSGLVDEQLGKQANSQDGAESFIYQFAHASRVCLLELQDENYPVGFKTGNYHINFSCQS